MGRIARSTLSLFVLALSLLAGSDWLQAAGGLQHVIEKFSLALVVPVAVGLLTIFLVALCVLGWLWMPRGMAPLDRALLRLRARLGVARWLFFLLFSFVPAWLFMYSPLGFKLTGVAFRLWVFLVVFAVMTYLATCGESQPLGLRPALMSVVLLGAVIIFGREFRTVTDFPLSLTWSEGNRIWDYSWLYGRRLYDYPLNARFDAYIDIGRQSLWGLPFLFNGVTLRGIRLWSALVFTVPYILFGWMALRRLPGRLGDWFWAGVWVFLFLYQGPIYTPLVLSAILVAGARRRPLWLALPLVYLAGYYAQASRLTWMIAPAVWAAMLALLDADPSADGRLSRRVWGQGVALGLAGLLGGVGLKRGWIRISRQLNLGAAQTHVPTPVVPTPTAPVLPGSPADAAEALSAGSNTILTDQPLLWSRLWPNPTNPLGVLPQLLLAVLPLVILLVYLLAVRRWRLNRWQQLTAGGASLGFLLIGLIISVKIGGGNNLHNLDMFLITLAFLAAVAWEHGGREMVGAPDAAPLGIRITLLLMALIPAFMPLADVAPLELPKAEHVEYTLSLLKAEVERVVDEGGEVLFMDQRQLLTFGIVQAPLVPQYEKKLVMDRALANDAEYFADFYRDLKNQRFDLIVVDPQRVRYAREDEAFGAENDAWVKWVTEPLYCYYTDKYSHDETGIYMFIPREDVDEDCAFPIPVP